jgi:hypothetical protein
MCATPVAVQTAGSEGARARAMLLVTRVLDQTSRYRGDCALVDVENHRRWGAAMDPGVFWKRMRW